MEPLEAVVVLQGAAAALSMLEVEVVPSVIGEPLPWRWRSELEAGELLTLASRSPRACVHAGEGFLKNFVRCGGAVRSTGFGLEVRCIPGGLHLLPCFFGSQCQTPKTGNFLTREGARGLTGKVVKTFLGWGWVAALPLRPRARTHPPTRPDARRRVYVASRSKLPPKTPHFFQLIVAFCARQSRRFLHLLRRVEIYHQYYK